MDLVGYDRQVFDRIVRNTVSLQNPWEYPHYLYPTLGIKRRQCRRSIGKYVVVYRKTILEYLETVHIGSDKNFADLRYPVQYVMRPNLDFRGFSSTVASGIIRKEMKWSHCLL